MFDSARGMWEAGDEPILGYHLTRYLGKGGFGEVWEATAPGGLLKAIKLVPVDEGEALLHCRELKGLERVRDVRHPYMLSIERFEMIECYLVIVMELADKNLSERYQECRSEGMAGIPREELLRHLGEAAEALDLLNLQFGLQHLDIKPNNLFLTSGHVKVADFGLVRSQNGGISHNGLALTPVYAPPELFAGQIAVTSDQYSLAVTYQELLTGTRPYRSGDVRRMLFQQMMEQPNLTSLPPYDIPVVARAMHSDPSQRYDNCRQFIKALARARTAAPATVAVPNPPAGSGTAPASAAAQVAAGTPGKASASPSSSNPSNGDPGSPNAPRSPSEPPTPPVATPAFQPVPRQQKLAGRDVRPLFVKQKLQISEEELCAPTQPARNAGPPADMSFPVSPQTPHAPNYTAGPAVNLPSIASAESTTPPMNPMALNKPATTSANAPEPPTLERDWGANRAKYRTAFLAFLPTEIFALKLRGFIDTLEGEVLSGSQERTLLRLGPRGGVFTTPERFFLQVDTYANLPNSGHRLVEAVFWSSLPNVKGKELTRRAILIIRLFKAHMLVNEEKGVEQLVVDARRCVGLV